MRPTFHVLRIISNDILHDMGQKTNVRILKTLVDPAEVRILRKQNDSYVFIGPSEYLWRW